MSKKNAFGSKVCCLLLKSDSRPKHFSFFVFDFNVSNKIFSTPTGYYIFKNFAFATLEAVLMEHLEKAAKNATMVSWQMQNDKIKCLSKFVRSKIKDEIPDYYVIITNEVTDRFCNKEILLLFLHYVIFCANKEPYICETYFDSLHIQGYWKEYFATGQRN